MNLRRTRKAHDLFRIAPYKQSNSFIAIELDRGLSGCNRAKIYSVFYGLRQAEYGLLQANGSHQNRGIVVSEIVLEIAEIVYGKAFLKKMKSRMQA